MVCLRSVNCGKFVIWIPFYTYWIRCFSACWPTPLSLPLCCVNVWSSKLCEPRPTCPDCTILSMVNTRNKGQWSMQVCPHPESFHCLWLVRKKISGHNLSRELSIILLCDSHFHFHIFNNNFSCHCCGDGLFHHHDGNFCQWKFPSHWHLCYCLTLIV